MSNILTADKYNGTRPYHSYKINAENAEAHGHKYWIDGVPVHHELVRFVNEFRAKRRNAALRVVGNPTYREYVFDAVNGDRSYVVWTSVGIIFPEMPDQAAGKLKYDTDKKAYVVESDKIINERYRSGSDHYNTKRTADMVKAIKTAMQYIKPLTFDEIRKPQEWRLTNALDSVRDPAEEKFRNTFAINKDDVAQEIAHMVALGYTPATKSFREAIDLMRTEGAELKRLKDYLPRACFVWSMPDRMAFQYSDESVPHTVTNMDDVPETIRDKLAVLSIADNDTTIPDVGHRISEKLYWVFV